MFPTTPNRALKIYALSLMLLGLSLVRAAEFRVLGLEQLKGLHTLEYVTADGVQQVPVSTAYISNAYPIPASGVVAFYDKAPVQDEVKAPLFTVEFPSSGGNKIVLLRGDAGGRTYRYGLIDDSSRGFPTGSAFFINFMQAPVMVKLGTNVIRLDAGSREVVPVVEQRAEPFRGGVKFATEINGEMQIFSQSSWYLLPSMKIFCIIYPDSSGVPRIRRIRMS